MRKLFYFLICTACLLLALLAPPLCMARALALTQTPSADEPRFTPPPGAETAAIKDLIDKAEGSLANPKITASALLTSPDYMPAHEWPRFRKLIRDHAKVHQLTIVTPQEPGASLIVTGAVRNQRGEAIEGALIYFYQTSAKGWYSDKAPHISGNSGDEKHARLFGYVRTNAEGQYELRTIRPAGYPRSNLPAHIHVEIETRDAESGDNGRHTLITEIQFEDDPRQTSEMRERGSREKALLVSVTRDASGTQRVRADFIVN
jgi:protocatechuate 3,4-dioxygenase beta subunit